MMLALQTPAPQAPSPLDPAQALAIQTRILDLQTRASVLDAQRAILVQRTHSDDAAVRASAEKTLLDVDLNVASARAELAVLQAQVGQSGGGNGTTTPPPFPDQGLLSKIDPDAITAVFVMTSIAVLIPLSIGIARRLWRRPATPPASALEDRIAPRLDRLENAVDSIAIEVERISESQRFVAKVLAERPAVAPPASSQPANNIDAIGEAKPFLALGAGPLEPIRKAERQTVKQSNTPH